MHHLFTTEDLFIIHMSDPHRGNNFYFIIFIKRLNLTEILINNVFDETEEKLK